MAKIPTFPSKDEQIPMLDDKSVNACLNLPSEHIKLLIANPRQSSSIPDRTGNQLVKLEQGEKWRTNPFFQQPMWTVNNVDYWDGDWVYIEYQNHQMNFLIESFQSTIYKKLSTIFT
jgi:hypothetical protein